ncbi:MAG TPA: Spy/CpxP family protein refolding chaperone [Pyrinomonadaceae bacterium]|nr:Spy/CpxP family protein refolding chaperone [Pyrinomonadaceae bacterium]
MKSNWKKISGVAALVGALLLMAVIGFSQEGRRPGPPPPGRGFHDGHGPHDGLGPLRDINLTDDQKAQIEKIKASFEESTKALHEQMRALHESQPDPLSGGAFDEAAVRAAAEARAKVQVELEVAHARAMSQVFALLTPEQKAQLAAKRQEFEQRHKERESERNPEQ